MSLSKLPYNELLGKIGDDSSTNQLILNQLMSLYKKGEIFHWQFISGFYMMRNREFLIFPVSLKNDSPIVRKYFFHLLRSRLSSSGAAYWSGYPESSDDDFKNLVNDLSKLDYKDLSSFVHMQDRIINSLAKLAIKSHVAADRIRDIASAFLDLPGGIQNESVQAMEEKIQQLSGNEYRNMIRI